MTREAFKIELNKLDLLHKKYTEAYETLLEHVRSGKLDFLKEDDKTYKEAEAAWHTQLKKVYPDQQEYEDCDQIQDRLETMAVEFTCEPEVPEEPDDNDFNVLETEVQWNQFAAVTQLQASLDQLARGWGKYPKGSTKNEYEGDYIVNIYKHGRRVQSFPITAYELDSDIPLEETIEVRVKSTWGDCFKRCTTLTGESVVLTDTKTKEIILRLHPNEKTPVIDSFGQTIGDAGRACFLDGTRIQFALPISADVYGGVMSIEYATMYAQRRMPDEVYWHTLHEITTLYALGCITQYEYFFLRGQSQTMRDQKREEWERMALPIRCAMMQTPLTEEEKWIR